MAHIIAVLLLFIPVLFAVMGVKLVRDTLFSILHWPFPNYPLQFFSALILFFTGIAFIAGYIYRRDLRRNKIKKQVRK